MLNNKQFPPPQQPFSASLEAFNYFSFCFLVLLALRMKSTSSGCLRVRTTRHSLSNRHHGFRLHVSPQHISHLPVDEGLELGAVGESYTHLRRVRTTTFLLIFILIFYGFKSFAWIVATLFGITGYATFTTLSQGKIYSTRWKA
jgi:hypothetical protein